MLLEPQDRLGVEVVGGLVEQQQVGLLQQQLAERDAAALTTGEHGDVGVRRRAAQGVHRLLELGVQVPGVGGVDGLLEVAHLGHQRLEVGVRLGHLGGDLVVPVELGLDLAGTLLDVAEDGLLLVELGLLHEDPDRVARGESGLAVRGLVQTGHDLQHGRLAGTVRADDADLGAGQERERDLVEDDLVAVRLAGARHHVDELGHGAQGIDHPGPSPESCRGAPRVRPRARPRGARGARCRAHRPEPKLPAPSRRSPTSSRTT